MVAKDRKPHTHERVTDTLVMYRSLEWPMRIVGWQFQGESRLYLTDLFDDTERIEAMTVLADRLKLERSQIRFSKDRV